MDPTFLWGEMIPSTENKLGLNITEREALGRISRPLAIEGPKFHQPTQQRTVVKTEPSFGDPVLLNSIKLLNHRRTLDRLLDTVETYKLGIASGELDKMPPLVPVPAMPEVFELERCQPSDYYCHRTSGHRLTSRVPEIGTRGARAGLRQAVIQLTTHAGYQTCSSVALELLTDSAQAFLTVFCRRLRLAVDHQLELAPAEDTGWSDALERVAVETGVASNTVSGQYRAGILAVGDYYEQEVLGQHKRLVQECSTRQERYRAELPGEAGGGSWPSQDDIPEMHFPSSDEGAGLGEGLLDHATPTLDVGMQMLQSLEASGDLDTPMSAESEALSGYSATPSPQVLTPGRGGANTPHTPHTPHSPVGGVGQGKKRRRSGGKFI